MSNLPLANNASDNSTVEHSQENSSIPQLILFSSGIQSSKQLLELTQANDLAPLLFHSLVFAL